MVSVVMYFQVHQPYRIRKYPVFDIGQNHHYFDDAKNRSIMHKVAQKCYLPANATILEQIQQTPGFRVAYSFSNVVLEQMEEYYPEVLSSFQELSDTGQVEILEETAQHSLAFLYSKAEFKEQVKLHRDKVFELFGQKPSVFRNTELVYNNELAMHVHDMGYKGILAEGADHVLGWKSPNYIYHPKYHSDMGLLLKNYRLSDDIAFRFSNKSWSGHPLTAPKFANWVSAVNGNGNVVNLFMDYETFGEHQWKDTGIFDFLAHMPREILKNPDNNFMTPSQAIDTHPRVGELDIHHFVSWADTERDLSAWTGNKMQQHALHEAFALEQTIKTRNDPALLQDWRRLLTSDHYYYMCVKWFNDMDVHKYFNPYDSPYDAYINFMNSIRDVKERLE